MNTNTYNLIKRINPNADGSNVDYVTTLSIRLPAEESAQDTMCIPVRDLGILALAVLVADGFEEDHLLRKMMRDVLDGNSDEAEDWLSERLVAAGEIEDRTTNPGHPRLVGDEALSYYEEDEDFDPYATDN